jgi:hydrogenase maturation factor
MVENLKIGDYVLAHGDLGIKKIAKKDAKEILKLNVEYHSLERSKVQNSNVK